MSDASAPGLAPASAASGPEANAERVRRMELVISYLLRIGVVVSLVVVVGGLVLSFVHHPVYVSSRPELHRLTSRDTPFPHTFSGLVGGLRELDGRAITALGLLLLIATPVLRVAVSIPLFVYQRDRTFAIVTAVVLTVLICSFVLGRAGG